MKVKIIGAGLAGCEAALQLANRGIQVDLYEMKPIKYTEAHSNSNYAELVCSNSFRNDTKNTPNGILIHELKQLHSHLIDIAYNCRIHKDDELIIDRDKFSIEVTKRIKNNKNIRVHTEVVDKIDDRSITIIATGPLTDDKLSYYFLKKFGNNNLSFQDSTCPIIYSESIDFKNKKVKIKDDKMLITLTKEEYNALLYKLQNAKVMVNKFDKEIELPQCCPIEYLAKKDPNKLLETKLFQNQKRTDKHYATVTLRKENEIGSIYSISGFMTQMQHDSQNIVIKSIPGLEKCKFARYGRSHKNTYFNSPNLLDNFFRINDKCYIIGQLSGIDGYVPSIATGIVAAYSIYSKIKKLELYEFPDKTMIGGFCNYIIQKTEDYTPMVASYHLLKQTKNYYNESKKELKKWIGKTKFIKTST